MVHFTSTFLFIFLRFTLLEIKPNRGRKMSALIILYFLFASVNFPQANVSLSNV